MGDDAFDENLLTEKLSKLNSSQQSIESLSRWCISNRKRAKQVVETWEKLFKSAQRDQQISFLYLANDILQNSRRKGSEFVNEFWKILPAALKSVYDLGHENCRKVASRLVNIWEERKVFGSRGQNLKNAILGKMTPVTVSNVKNSNPIKVVKRDGNSLRIKLAVGGMPEKILTAFQLVHDEDVNEEAALKQCGTAVSCIQEMEKEVQNVSSQGNLQGSDLVDKIQEQENTLQQCVGQLENAGAIRVALVSQLKEALEDQETKLALIRSELHVAQGLIERASNMRQRLVPGFSVPTPVNQLMETNAPRMVELKFPATQSTNNPLAPPPPTHPLTPFSTSNLSEEESKKATVAAVAAKLAASTSSAQMLTSVLSSLVAEEAASMSSGLKSAGFPSLPILPPDKRQKLDKSTPFSGMDNSDAGSSVYFSTTQQAMANMPPNSMQSVAQTNRMQAPFLPPLPPPPPLAPPSNSPASQLVQSAMGGPPYGYGAGNLLPPSLSSNIAMGLARPGPPQQAQPQQLQNQQPQQQQQQPPPPNGGYYRPPGIGFYGQSHQPSTPPVPRQ